MNRTLLLLMLCFTALVGRAQIHFYLDQITVTPPAPTTADEVTIDLIGNLSDTGAEVLVLGAGVAGTQVDITLMATSTGGLAVLVPHTETIELGQLPAGTYSIYFTDATTGMLDSAPLEQHSFTVSGPEFPCEDLTVDVKWAYFSDTAVVVHVQHTTQEVFDYPSFILFDAQGDTLAKETTDLFGIAQDSWHTMRLMDGATPPTGPFDGRLELWTNFTSTLACTWEQTFDLCPETACHTVYPTLANFGGALTIGVFNYIISDMDGEVASGQFVLTNDMQLDQDTLCLPAGAYRMGVGPLAPPTGGNPMYYLAGPGFQATETWPVVWSLPTELAFVVLPYCEETPQGIADEPKPGLRTATTPGGLWVQTTDGRSLGMLHLLDVQGRTLHATTTTADQQYLPVSTPGVYILHAGDRTLKVAVGWE